MKPRLPSLLVAAIVALQAANPLLASTTLVSGKAYDVGKVSYSTDEDATYPTTPIVKDTEYCWVASGSNIVEYWQDTYGSEEKYRNGDLISGTRTGYDEPYGTDYLNVYHEALTQAKEDKTGSSTQFVNWWMYGKDSMYTSEETQSAGALSNTSGHYTVFDSSANCTKQMTYISPEDTTLKEVSDFLSDAFSVQGQAVQLDTYGNAHHAISCWGYETDENGVVTALYLTDSDDNYFGAFRMTVKQDDNYLGQMLPGYPLTDFYGPTYVLDTEDEFGYYGHVDRDEEGGYHRVLAGIIGLTYIDTEAAQYEGSSIAKAVTDQEGQPEATVESGSTVLSNTLLKGETDIKGDGITVGDGKSVVILSGDTLSLDGNKTSTTAGISTKQGSMVSLEELSVTGYQNGGLDLHSKTYIHDGYLNVTSNDHTGKDGGGIYTDSHLDIGGNKNHGEGTASVNISANKALNGGGIYVSGEKAINRDVDPTKIIVSLHDNEDVTISGNSATNSGGGVYVEKDAVLNIHDNGDVRFSGNSAGTKGNDIYNAEGGTVVISGNKSVSFESKDNGEAAVTNDGVLYLVASEGKTVTFDGTKLDGKGTTYVGTDTLAGEYEGKVEFTSSNQNNKVSITGKRGPGEVESFDWNQRKFVAEPAANVWHAAELKNATVSAEEITGAKDNLGSNVSYLTNSSITVAGALTMRNVTLDNTDVITVTGTNSMVTLDDVAITLNSGVAKTSSGAYDISGMFSGKFTINSLYFDSEELKNSDTIYLGTNLTEGDAAANLWIGEGQYYIGSYNSATGIVTFSDEIGSVPEPTTGTLSLLALAGLCARRRRR